MYPLEGHNLLNSTDVILNLNVYYIAYFLITDQRCWNLCAEEHLLNIDYTHYFHNRYLMLPVVLNISFNHLA